MAEAGDEREVGMVSDGDESVREERREVPAPGPEKRFLTPPEIAEEVVRSSMAKCRGTALNLMVLGVLAGVYIGFGAQLCTMVTHDLAKYLGVGMAKFMGGSVFTVGLMLVVLGGAELFTGNCLLLTGVLARRCTMGGVLRNCVIVYTANFAGSILLAAIMYWSGLWKTGNGAVGVAAVKIASAKTALSFGEAFFRGVGCNWLVCLAVWLAIGGRDIASKILGIYFPIMAFVASGFEHSVANMYFIPIGLFLRHQADIAMAAGPATSLTWPGFLWGNLLPVTLGNIVGGALFVGALYYVVYLRRRT